MGLFITIEGPDGSGKSTQVEKLAALANKNTNKNNWILTKNPGGTSLGIKIRKLLLEDTSVNLHPIAELFMYMADRAQHVNEVVKPALKDGKIVICDRFIDSTVAYQGYARGLDKELISNLNNLATQNIKPDLTIILDVSPEIGLKRASLKYNGSHDKLEAEGLDFQRKVREGFLELAQKEIRKFRVINTEELTIEEVHQKILEEINVLVANS
ncbi:MAG: dTMP kinase [Candidatus Caenarcaniphilales bacterium]|nr:dTMP kinase [Candidatus Caenarcaniphilales bacterium]